VTALTGKRAPADHYGTVIDAPGKAAMNATQQIVTALMAVLMLATILAMPAQVPSRVVGGSALRQAGSIATAPENRTELGEDLVRDLTDN